MRLLLKPHIPGPVVNLAIASLLSVYMFYGFVSMPLDLDQSEVMFWVYAKGKIANGLVSYLFLVLSLKYDSPVIRE